MKASRQAQICPKPSGQRQILHIIVMATALQGFRLTARSSQCRPHAQRYLAKSIGRRRAFSSTPPILTDSQTANRESTSYTKPVINKNSERWDISDERYQKYQEALKHVGESDLLSNDENARSDLNEEVLENLRLAGIELPSEAPRRQKLKQTFLNMGDPEPFEDDNFEFEADTHEELSSLAHGELEHHREMRHYARLAAWEMPLLSSMLQLVREV